MLQRANIRMTTTIPRLELLREVRNNFKRHTKIVAEARKGYMKKAKAELAKRLKQLENGEVVSLKFSLTPPVDYSKIYQSSISMLEHNIQENVELQADEFNQLVNDEWDWTHNFLFANMHYSKTANMMAGSLE